MSFHSMVNSPSTPFETRLPRFDLKAALYWSQRNHTPIISFSLRETHFSRGSFQVETTRLTGCPNGLLPVSRSSEHNLMRAFTRRCPGGEQELGGCFFLVCGVGGGRVSS